MPLRVLIVQQRVRGSGALEGGTCGGVYAYDKLWGYGDGSAMGSARLSIVHGE